MDRFGLLCEQTPELGSQEGWEDLPCPHEPEQQVTAFVSVERLEVYDYRCLYSPLNE